MPLTPLLQIFFNMNATIPRISNIELNWLGTMITKITDHYEVQQDSDLQNTTQSSLESSEENS